MRMGRASCVFSKPLMGDYYPPSLTSHDRKPNSQWSRIEIRELIRGCFKYGVGNWGVIAADSSIKCGNRGACELMQTFVTLFPQEYTKICPNGECYLDPDFPGPSILEIVNCHAKMNPTLTSRVLSSSGKRKKCSFTDDEDICIFYGYGLCAGRWTHLQCDKRFPFKDRKSTDLRDRFRNAFPSIYVAWGFTPRRPKDFRTKTKFFDYLYNDSCLDTFIPNNISSIQSTIQQDKTTTIANSTLKLLPEMPFFERLIEFDQIEDDEVWSNLSTAKHSDILLNEDLPFEDCNENDILFDAPTI